MTATSALNTSTTISTKRKSRSSGLGAVSAACAMRLSASSSPVRRAGGRRLDLIALALEQIAQESGGVGAVFDDEDARGLGLHGVVTSWVSSVVAISRASSSGVNGFAT